MWPRRDVHEDLGERRGDLERGGQPGISRPWSNGVQDPRPQCPKKVKEVFLLGAPLSISPCSRCGVAGFAVLAWQLGCFGDVAPLHPSVAKCE